MKPDTYNIGPEMSRHIASDHRRQAARLMLAAAGCFMLCAGFGFFASAWAFLAFAGAAGLWACAMASMGKAVDFARHAALLEKTEAHECSDLR